MRMKFIVMSSLTGCLALLLGSAPGHSRLPGSQRGRPPGGDGSATVPADPARLALADPPPRQEARPAVPQSWIDERFRRLDKDGDGYLSYDEMTENLKAEKDRWDLNKDGKIDLAEWRAYIEALIAQRRPATERAGSGRPGGTKGPTKGPGPRAPGRARTDQGKAILQVLKEKDEQNKKGTGPRAAKPPESPLPPAYRHYDTDGDGQIALYEWKDKGGRVAEFLKLDLNGDGFLTPDELMPAGPMPAQGPNVPTLSRSERDYLRNLAQRSSSICIGSEPLREELRRLRALGLIETPKANLYEMWDGHKVNLHDFCRITERGRQFLRGRLH
jgi:hypothetical protein